MKYLSILLTILACNNAPSLPAEAPAKAGDQAEAPAKAGDQAEAPAKAGDPTEAPAKAGSATTTAPSSTMASTGKSDSLVPPQYVDGKLVKVEKNEDAWKRELTENEFYVLRKEGTERAFTGDLWDNHEHGIFVCAGCGLPLFTSETKFDSGTGWPSFYKPISEDCIADKTDSSHGMDRTEVECARCGGHQGHVFPDGPPPTGLRYCINSVSLDFVKR